MSETQAAMREFRFLDDKRKTNGLTPEEEQRWLELGQALGVDMTQPQVPQPPQPGYYGPDGQWYPYPAGYAPPGWGQAPGWYPPPGQYYDPNYPPQYPPPGYPPPQYPPAYDPNYPPPQYPPPYGAAPYDPNYPPPAYPPQYPPAYDPNYPPPAYGYPQAGWPQQQWPQQPQQQWPEQAQPEVAPAPPPSVPEVSADQVMEVGDDQISPVLSAPTAPVAPAPVPAPPAADHDPVADLRDALSLDDDPSVPKAALASAPAPATPAWLAAPEASALQAPAETPAAEAEIPFADAAVVETPSQSNDVPFVDDAVSISDGVSISEAEPVAGAELPVLEVGSIGVSEVPAEAPVLEASVVAEPPLIDATADVVAVEAPAVADGGPELEASVDVSSFDTGELPSADVPAPVVAELAPAEQGPIVEAVVAEASVSSAAPASVAEVEPLPMPNEGVDVSAFDLQPVAERPAEPSVEVSAFDLQPVVSEPPAAEVSAVEQTAPVQEVAVTPSQVEVAAPVEPQPEPVAAPPVDAIAEESFADVAAEVADKPVARSFLPPVPPPVVVRPPVDAYSSMPTPLPQSVNIDPALLRPTPVPAIDPMSSMPTPLPTSLQVDPALLRPTPPPFALGGDEVVSPTSPSLRAITETAAAPEPVEVIRFAAPEKPPRPSADTFASSPTLPGVREPPIPLGAPIETMYPPETPPPATAFEALAIASPMPLTQMAPAEPEAPAPLPLSVPAVVLPEGVSAPVDPFASTGEHAVPAEEPTDPSREAWTRRDPFGERAAPSDAWSPAAQPEQAWSASAEPLPVEPQPVAAETWSAPAEPQPAAADAWSAQPVELQPAAADAWSAQPSEAQPVAVDAWSAQPAAEQPAADAWGEKPQAPAAHGWNEQPAAQQAASEWSAQPAEAQQAWAPAEPAQAAWSAAAPATDAWGEQQSVDANAFAAPVDFSQQAPDVSGVDLSGAAGDAPQMAEAAEFVGYQNERAAMDVSVAPEGAFEIDSGPVASLATGVANQPEGGLQAEEPMQLASSVEFMQGEILNTGAAWERTGPVVELNTPSQAPAAEEPPPEDEPGIIQGVVLEEEPPGAAPLPRSVPGPLPTNFPPLNTRVAMPIEPAAMPPVPAPLPLRPAPVQVPVQAASVPMPDESWGSAASLPPVPATPIALKPVAVAPAPIRPAPVAPLPLKPAAVVPGGPVAVRPDQLFDRSGGMLREDEKVSMPLPGEHRVILHTTEGQVKRGVLRDPDLAAETITLESGATREALARARVKALFFMLGPGPRPATPEGQKVRVTFKDGRQVMGFSTDHQNPGPGFFVVLADNRTNTERIFVYRHAVQNLSIDR